jgi:L-ascorbate metabolism protein UlaG (beta-lactamase superfamily)
VRHVAELARFAANKASRERDDSQALRELERTALGLPAGLEIEWLGVAGYRVSFEGRSLLIDPYVSRAPFSSLVRGRPALPDPSLHERYLGHVSGVEAILVGHTHWDHAVDAPVLARRFGCPALGSASLAHLMALHGEAARAVEAEPHRAYELGPFTVTFVPSVHSKLVLGLKVPYDGELTCAHLDGLAPKAYRCGQVWGIRIAVGGTTLYHQGSADLLDDEVREPVDVFLAGVAGRGFTRDYWPRILQRLSPRLVLASHYDNFFTPLSEPMGFATNVNIAGLPGEIAAVTGDIEVAALPAFAPAT